MAKKQMKTYTAEAWMQVRQGVFARYQFEAESDEAALKKIRSMLKTESIYEEAIVMENDGDWYDATGTFSLVAGDEMPFEDDVEQLIVSREEFVNKE